MVYFCYEISRSAGGFTLSKPNLSTTSRFVFVSAIPFCPDLQTDLQTVRYFTFKEEVIFSFEDFAHLRCLYLGCSTGLYEFYGFSAEISLKQDFDCILGVKSIFRIIAVLTFGEIDTVNIIDSLEIDF